MRKLLVFNLISLDGYFVDSAGDMSWAHSSDPEFDAFAQENARGGGVLLFGRVTYELMAGYWPTSAARESNAVVAERMNALPKVVFSRTMEEAGWNNTRLVKSDVAAEIRAMKAEPGPGLAIMGSGTIVSLAAREGLVDEFQFVVVPLVLGSGRTLFEGLEKRIRLELTRTRAFRNGNVLLCYEPMKP